MKTSFEVTGPKKEFKKVSYNQFYEDYVKTCIECFCDTSSDGQSHNKYHDIVRPIYDNIPLPKRATIGSAGYDFVTPMRLVIPAHFTCTIPTGICASMEPDWVLQIYPRSSLGFKYGIQLVNTVGIIDSDYIYANNEGHIIIKLINNSNDTVTIGAMERIVQGIFIQYGTTYNDAMILNSDDAQHRTGGFGSTGQI